jgi:hypothetical protein
MWSVQKTVNIKIRISLECVFNFQESPLHQNRIWLHMESTTKLKEISRALNVIKSSNLKRPYELTKKCMARGTLSVQFVT